MLKKQKKHIEDFKKSLRDLQITLLNKEIAKLKLTLDTLKTVNKVDLNMPIQEWLQKEQEKESRYNEMKLELEELRYKQKTKSKLEDIYGEDFQIQRLEAQLKAEKDKNSSIKQRNKVIKDKLIDFIETL